MNSKQLISKNIEVFYNKASEETRRDKGMGVFEFQTTGTPGKSGLYFCILTYLNARDKK